MAKLHIHKSMLEWEIFGYTEHPVEILNVEYEKHRGVLVFEIAGPDVPDTEEIIAVCTTDQNRIGQRLIRMNFVPAESYDDFPVAGRDDGWA
jgi:hypothetical protein